jgi:TolA-binding protein
MKKEHLQVPTRSKLQANNLQKNQSAYGGPQMKIETKSAMLKTRNYNPETKTFLRPVGAMALHFSVCIFSFLLLPLRPSTSLAGAKSSSEHINKNNIHVTQQGKSEPNRFTPAPILRQEDAGAANTISHAEDQLRRVILSVPERKKDNKSKDELKQLIQQVCSIEFKAQKSPESAIATEPPTPATKPDKIPLNIESQKPDKRKETEAELPYEPIADQTLEKLKNLSQHPDQVSNPFQLAEILFLSGHLKEAATFYQEALNRTGKDSNSPAEDRAWILFQIGNCLQNDDPPTAIKAYRQLITEYPSAPWTEIAKTLEKLIDWYQKDKPRESIAERKS